MSATKTFPTVFLKTLQVFTVIFAMLLVYAVLPAPARAAGLTEEQMTAVTSLLTAFGTEKAVIENVQMALRGASKEEILKAMGSASNAASSTLRDIKKDSSLPPAASICAVFARTLARGTSGEDVSTLQAFLEQTGDLKEASTTGFFGPATEAALKAWQAKEGIVTEGDSATTGFGATGPKTRAVLMERCKGLEEKRMQTGEPKRPATTTPPMPPKPRTTNTGETSQNTQSTLERVSSLMVSGMAAVFEGYLSLFGQ